MLRGVFLIVFLLLGALPGEHGHLTFDEPARECAVCAHAHQLTAVAPPALLGTAPRFAEFAPPAALRVETFINGRHLFKRAPKVSPPA
jgi:hypothetical protein